MQLYCQCGYPIHVSISWNGQDHHLLLRDGAFLSMGQFVAQCPHCHSTLALSQLRESPGPLISMAADHSAEPAR